MPFLVQVNRRDISSTAFDICNHIRRLLAGAKQAGAAGWKDLAAAAREADRRLSEADIHWVEPLVPDTNHPVFMRCAIETASGLMSEGGRGIAGMIRDAFAVYSGRPLFGVPASGREEGGSGGAGGSGGSGSGGVVGVGGGRVSRESGLVLAGEGRATKSTWKWITYGEVIGRAEAVARGFSRLGLQAGCHIGIFGKNRPEWYIVDAACALGCFTSVGLHVHWKPKDIAYVTLWLIHKREYDRGTGGVCSVLLVLVCGAQG